MREDSTREQYLPGGLNPARPEGHPSGREVRTGAQQNARSDHAIARFQAIYTWSPFNIKQE